MENGTCEQTSKVSLLGIKWPAHTTCFEDLPDDMLSSSVFVETCRAYILQISALALRSGIISLASGPPHGVCGDIGVSAGLSFLIAPHVDPYQRSRTRIGPHFLCSGFRREASSPQYNSTCPSFSFLLSAWHAVSVWSNYRQNGLTREQDQRLPQGLGVHREGFRVLASYNLPLERRVKSVEVIRFRPRGSRRCFVGLHSYLSAWRGSTIGQKPLCLPYSLTFYVLHNGVGTHISKSKFLSAKAVTTIMPTF